MAALIPAFNPEAVAAVTVVTFPTRLLTCLIFSPTSLTFPDSVFTSDVISVTFSDIFLRLFNVFWTSPNVGLREFSIVSLNERTVFFSSIISTTRKLVNTTTANMIIPAQILFIMPPSEV